MQVQRYEIFFVCPILFFIFFLQKNIRRIPKKNVPLQAKIVSQNGKLFEKEKKKSFPKRITSFFRRNLKNNT